MSFLVRSCIAVLSACLLLYPASEAQETPSASASPSSQQPAPPPPPPEDAQQTAPAAVSPYRPAIFINPISHDQLAFLAHFDGAPARDLYRDKQFHKLLKGIIPTCMFHYGSDMPLDDALGMVLKDSRIPVQIRAGRYLILSGLGGPYLAGRGFLWMDLQQGVALGGFYFHPTNGEPTPTLAVFSRQVKQELLAFSDLPPDFNNDLIQWSTVSSVPPVSTAYFLTGANRRVLLEHNQDYCSMADGTVAPPGDICEQMNADAADVDMNAAYYLDQVNYATNATAWMIGPDQTAWLTVRDRTCGVLANPLGCRIRMTRERTHIIVRRGGVHLGHR